MGSAHLCTLILPLIPLGVSHARTPLSIVRFAAQSRGIPAASIIVNCEHISQQLVHVLVVLVYIGADDTALLKGFHAHGLTQVFACYR